MQNYSILGIDVGNATTVTSSGILFESKITNSTTFNSYDTIFINNKMYTLGEGEFDTTYRKIDKKSYEILLYGAIALGSKTVHNNIILGLPLSQYKEDKNQLINRIISNNEKYILLNGEEKHIIIDDIDVFPEGIVTVDDNFEGIIVDIGGRTTDAAMIINDRGKRKIINPISLPIGIINLYMDFINELNNRFGLDLFLRDAERIIKNGLILDGRYTEITKELSIFNEFIDTLIGRLQIEYSLRSNIISLTGGGSKLLHKVIKDRLGECVSLQENSIIANARAYYELGCTIWQNHYQ